MKSGYFLITASLMAAMMSVSCGTATNIKHPYTLNEKYSGVNLSGRKIVAVLPDDSNIVILNKKDVADDYGGQNASPESRIRKYYFPIFSQTLKNFASGDSFFLLNDYKPGLLWDTLGHKEVILKSDLDSAESDSTYRIPEKAHVQAVGLDSTVVLIIQTIRFKRNNLQVEYYWDDKTRKPANLEADAKVLVWDYAADAPVFYGTITEKVVFQFGMSRKHWDESAYNLAKKIMALAKCL